MSKIIVDNVLSLSLQVLIHGNAAISSLLPTISPRSREEFLLHLMERGRVRQGEGETN
jgi:hypothetical protein